MPCFHPLTAYQSSDGSISFTERKGGDVVRSLSLPCGQCVGCRLERSRQWAMRCMHEASLYSRNCFITLTYNNEHLPSDKSLQYPDFQKFMKRLRKRFNGVDRSANPDSKDQYPIRFYMCGEYGETFGRPHYHACLFNFDFPDKTLYRRSPSGSLIYRSKALEELWPFGFSSIGEVNFNSAAYVARYIMKKVTGHRSEEYYRSVDPDTGEIINRVPEFNKMSLKPGIGADWLARYKTDVYPHDYVIVNGKKVKPPRYYDNKYSAEFPDIWEDIEYNRFVDAQNRVDDNTPERLAVKAELTRQRVSRLFRSLEV